MQRKLQILSIDLKQSNIENYLGKHFGVARNQQRPVETTSDSKFQLHF